MYMNDGIKTKINLRNKSVFITGVAGFIGSNLAKRLLSTVEGVKVVGLDNMNHYYDVRLKEARLNELEQFDNFSFVKGNLADKAVIESIFEQYKPEIVVNLGAQAGVRYSITNPDAYVEANLIGFYNILEACRHSYDEGHTPVEHLVYASSSSVYGSNKKVPYSTDDKVDNPVSLYAATKKSNELMAHGYFNIQTSEDGYDYTLYNKDFTVMDGGIIEVDGYRPVQEMMEEVLAEHGHSVSECGVISTAYLQEQSYRAETQRAEAMKEKLVAEKPAPEANISFYVAECAEFPVMGEFHGNLTLEQALEIYDKIPAERMNGIKSIGFSLEDGSIYSGMFDLMVGGEVQAEVVNHIQHYRESPLVQKAISDMKTLLEKRQASKELEERPNTRQSVREALKNRKKAQEQQPHQEQAKPKKAKKKGEIEL